MTIRSTGSGEYLVLVQPHMQHDGRRRWVVMATYDHDEHLLALNLAQAYEQRGHVVAVAEITSETAWPPPENDL